MWPQKDDHIFLFKHLQTSSNRCFNFACMNCRRLPGLPGLPTGRPQADRRWVDTRMKVIRTRSGGWDKGIPTMMKGERSLFTMDSSVAYGANGAGYKILPNATVRFDIELLGWEEIDDPWHKLRFSFRGGCS